MVFSLRLVWIGGERKEVVRKDILFFLVVGFGVRLFFRFFLVIIDNY